MIDINNMEEDTIYEVLITSKGDDIHTKPFGIKINNNKLILNLYPNKTLSNLKKNNSFLVQFTSNPLLYTKALFNELDVNDYSEDYTLKDVSCVLKAKTIELKEHKVEDKFGKNSITTIISDIIDISIKKNQIPVINRATNLLIELLIDYTRYNFMNEVQKNYYIDKILKYENLIRKAGNYNHIQSLRIIKKEIGLKN